MDYDELAIKIEDLLLQEDVRDGSARGSYFADIMDWLFEIGGDYDETNIIWLKSQYADARL